jgi:catechol 2,3-dioxygenase-like lactoylglutathione lyase family enzyme
VHPTLRRSATLLAVAAIAAAGAAGAAVAAQRAAPRAPPATLDLQSALDAGWQEAVISVRDPRPLLQFMTQVAGWQVHSEAPLSAAEGAFYRLDVAGARSTSQHAVARQWLVTDAAGKPGFVRLIAFGAVDALPVRAGAMPWDSGGIFSLMSRTNATGAVYRGAQQLGWDAYNDPVELDLRDTGVKLTNVILRGPDGVNISVYERLAPRMPDDSDLQRLRRPFNSMQTVRDIDAARRFYLDVLGFELLNSGMFENPVRAPNNFGVPANLVVANPMPFAIAGPRRTGPTQVELVQLAGVEGRDLAARAVPPNYGIVALRFPVSRLGPIEARLRARGWPIAAGPTSLVLPPYGAVRMLAVQSPDGAWLEFFERVPQ